MFGYPALVLSLFGTGFLAFGLWVHHMFVTGLPRLGESFFTASSMAVAIPSGLQIFCWIATLWDGKLKFNTPLLFVFGFILNFVIGGLTGVMVASVPIDTQVHDTYFVVAHFHYVLIGGAVFPLLGGIYYWFPEILRPDAGRAAGPAGISGWRWSASISRSFPMHILGLMGMPRRVYTYPAGDGLGADEPACHRRRLRVLRQLPAAGLQHLAQPAARRSWPAPIPGTPARWNGRPPRRRPPIISPISRSCTDREPLWETPEPPVVAGLRVDRREFVVTTLVDAEPDMRETSPPPSIWPFIAALVTSVTLLASIFTPWAIVWGAAARRASP